MGHKKVPPTSWPECLKFNPLYVLKKNEEISNGYRHCREFSFALLKLQTLCQFIPWQLAPRQLVPYTYIQATHPLDNFVPWVSYGPNLTQPNHVIYALTRGQAPRTPLWGVTKGDELSRSSCVGDELSGTRCQGMNCQWASWRSAKLSWRPNIVYCFQSFWIHCKRDIVNSPVMNQLKSSLVTTLHLTADSQQVMRINVWVELKA